MKLFVYSIVFAIILASSVSAYQLQVSGGKIDISVKAGGSTYDSGPVDLKLSEGEAFEVHVNPEASSEIGIVELRASDSSYITVVEGPGFNSPRSFSGSSGKQSFKWVLKPSYTQSTRLDFYYSMSANGTQNIANITVEPLLPQSIFSIKPDRLDKGFSGNVSISGKYFPTGMIASFFKDGKEDYGIKAKLVEYINKTDVVYLVNVSQNATGGKRTVVLSTASGTSFPFENYLEILGPSSDFAGDLKVDHAFSPSDKRIFFYAYSPMFTGIPTLIINNDPAKTNNSMFATPNKTGSFFLNTTYEKAGVKEGDLLVYTVSAGGKIAIKSFLVAGSKVAVKETGLKIPAIKSIATAGIFNLDIKATTNLILMGLFVGLIQGGIAVNSENYVLEVEIENSTEYENKTDDFHIIFGGKITDCEAVFPEWVCKESGNEVDLTGPPLPVGKPLNLTTVSGENVAIIDYWATSNGTKIEKMEKFEPKEIEDCTDYCTGMTDEEFKKKINEYVQAACDRMKDALNCLKSGKIKGVLDKVAMIYKKPLSNQANIDRLIRILEKSLEKCKDITIECDSSWNWHCTEDVNAYMMTPFGVPYGNLHLCPAFCTAKDQEGTILHEITHFGNSTDDIYDDFSAHALEPMTVSIQRSCK